MRMVICVGGYAARHAQPMPARTGMLGLKTKATSGDVMLKLAAAGAAMMMFATSGALAEGGRMRVASESEIRDVMNERSKDVVTHRNGYTYQRGKSVGYRISNGRICMRFANGSSDCVSVETDGKSFDLITRHGERSKL